MPGGCGKISAVFKMGPLIIQRLFIGLLVLGLTSVLIPRLLTGLHARSRVFNMAEVKSRQVAIVFGAGLQRDGTPTRVLRERIATAADLYFAGRVEKILMSGDKRFEDYNEPAAMRVYALNLGVPDRDIVLDFAGRSTYDTCYRAGAIFGVQDAILVTQNFHLPRALYTCNLLGVSAVGVPADRFNYRRRSTLYWSGREVAATLAAFWDLHISRPLPVLGQPEPIFPLEQT